MEIRPVEAGDYEALNRFFENNNQPEVLRQFHPFPFSSDVAKKIASGCHLDRYYVIMSRSDEVAGLSMLRGWDEGYEIPSFGILIDRQYRRRGLGRVMTEFAIAEAKRLNCNSLRLSVYKSNQYAKRLYESLGFKEIEKEAVLIAGDSDVKIVMIRKL